MVLLLEEIAEEVSAEESAPQIPILHTVEKAIHVLQDVVAAKGAVGVTDVARRVGINTSTVYRILATYKAYGLVEQDASNKYYPGIGLLKLVGPLMSRLEPVKVARPVMERLARKTGESINLMIPDGDQGVYVDSVQGWQSIRMVVEIGTREYYHCSGVGKAVLSYLPQETFDALAAAGFKKQTAQTITDPSALLDHLKQVREQGYAIDNEEGEEGTRCIGAPIFNGIGEIVGGISLSGPSFRLSQDVIESLIPQVTASAREISILLGYSDDHNN